VIILAVDDRMGRRHYSLDVTETAASLKSPWLIAFVAVALAHLVMSVVRVPSSATIVTWALAPLLAIWVWRSRGPKLLIVALLLCFVSDVLGNPRFIGLGPGALYASVAALVAILLFRRVLSRRTTPARGIWIAIAGGVFLGLQQLLAALEVTGRVDGAATWYKLTVLTLYPLGILLIAVGVVGRPSGRL
jgi:uncharacterized membrane protein